MVLTKQHLTKLAFTSLATEDSIGFNCIVSVNFDRLWEWWAR